MGNVTEIQQAKKWIYDSLLANSDILAAVSTRIYDTRVPEPPASRVFPYIVFDYLGGTDVDALGTSRLFARPLFQIRVVADVTDAPISTTVRTVDKRIDDVLQVAVYVASGDYYFTARREQPVDRSETDTTTGRRYHNLGGLYRLWIGRST